MIRLIFSDLRDHITTWVGAFVVAIACGYIGAWVVSIRETAAFAPESVQWSMQNASSMMLAFSLIAGVAVLISAANLTVSVQRRSYALWQLANVRPVFVSVVVLAQMAVVAVLGAICGALLASITFVPLFPLVFSAREEISQVVPCVGVSAMPIVWLVIVIIFLGGGLKGARSAGTTSPLTVLREPEPKHMKMTWLRALFFITLTACSIWLYFVMAESAPIDAMSFSPFMLILIVATLVPIAPLIFSSLLCVWTLLVPNRWSAWYLARHTSRYGLSISTSVETPIMVGFGLVAGLFSIISIMTSYAEGLGDFGTVGLDSTTTLLMLGGPVLLCAVGAAVSVVMAARSRTRDVALLTASGALPSTLVSAAVCEALIHTTTATLVGICSVVISNALMAHVLGLPLFADLNIKAGFIVSLVGFALILIATLIPTIKALNQDTATVLTMQQ